MPDTTPSGPPRLACPACGEPARAIAPRAWPLSGWAPRPGHSHHDGTPLCPVVGDGYEPAGPIPAARPAPANRTTSQVRL